MMRSTRALLVVLLLAPLPASAQEDGVLGRWSVSFEGGADGLTGGSVHRGGTGQLAGSPITIERRGFPQLFIHGWRAGLGVGYGVAERIEVIGKLSRGGLTGKHDPVGALPGFTVIALFGDYRDVALEGGVRYHLPAQGRVSTHVNALVGIRRVQAMGVSLSTWSADPAMPTPSFPNLPFYEASFVPSAGADFGLSYRLTPRTSVGAEVGFRYQGGMNGNDTAVGPLGLGGVNDAGTRWSVPFVGVLRLHF
jgi:hypothetical protein